VDIEVRPVTRERWAELEALETMFAAAGFEQVRPRRRRSIWRRHA
jgi:hypothetical protein